MKTVIEGIMAMIIEKMEIQTCSMIFRDIAADSSSVCTVVSTVVVVVVAASCQVLGSDSFRTVTFSGGTSTATTEPTLPTPKKRLAAISEPMTPTEKMRTRSIASVLRWRTKMPEMGWSRTSIRRQSTSGLHRMNPYRRNMKSTTASGLSASASLCFCTASCFWPPSSAPSATASSCFSRASTTSAACRSRNRRESSVVSLARISSES
mmetsp:Transcript_55379/g.142625  ORF Transcript_55379/g.142625 Transcript_55379/m.142625 type:complete len:208 (+) Transcript_55379:144-767(+)